MFLGFEGLKAFGERWLGPTMRMLLNGTRRMDPRLSLTKSYKMKTFMDLKPQDLSYKDHFVIFLIVACLNGLAILYLCYALFKIIHLQYAKLCSFLIYRLHAVAMAISILANCHALTRIYLDFESHPILFWIQGNAMGVFFILQVHALFAILLQFIHLYSVLDEKER